MINLDILKALLRNTTGCSIITESQNLLVKHIKTKQIWVTIDSFCSQTFSFVPRFSYLSETFIFSPKTLKDLTPFLLKKEIFLFWSIIADTLNFDLTLTLSDPVHHIDF